MATTRHTPLPLDVRLMTLVTHVLVGVFGLLCTGLLATWLVQHPVWSVQAITVQGDVAHQNAVSFRAQLAKQMKSRLTGSFVTVDLGEVREVF